MNSDNRTDAAANDTGAQTKEYQQRLERYEQDFLQVLRLESPPHEEMRQGLRQLQQSLGLADQDVEAIETNVTHDFQTQTQAYREHLYRYEQEFSEAIRQEFPLSSASQNRLWRLQESLGLQSVDVIKIQGQLLSKKGEQPLSPESSATSPFAAQIITSPISPSSPSSHPDPQPTISPPPTPDPQDFRLPDPLEAKLVDDIDLDPFTTSPPFSKFAEDITYLPLPIAAESEPNLQPPLFLPNTQLDPPNLHSDWNIDYTHLHELLEANQWEEADGETLDVMLQATGRTKEGWLDAAAIAKFPGTDLQTIDRLWGRHSDDQFSFTVQRRLYSGVIISGENAVNPNRSDEEQALEFSKNVGWWSKRLEFLRYYHQLDFTPQAPNGHLPALWFWTIPWWEAIQYGGIGSGRGGCRIDHRILTAFIKRLKQCDV